MTRIGESEHNKYHAKRTYSELVGRWFDSKLEARRGEELKLLEMAGEIASLCYQVKYTLSISPKISVIIDFNYYDKRLDKWIWEDAKGILTKEARVKYAWLKTQNGIEVKLWRGKGTR